MRGRVLRHHVWGECVAIGLTAGALTASCRDNASAIPRGGLPTTLRVGVGQVSAQNPNTGLRQLNSNLSVESLGRLGEDGHVEPQLAEKWALTDDGRTLRVTLKPGSSFTTGR